MPDFDFKVPGVTSISADVHKYGYSIKGASVLLYPKHYFFVSTLIQNRFKNEKYRKYQFYAWSGWPGGLFVSPTMQGTRSGGPIAAAWASMLAMVSRVLVVLLYSHKTG